MYIQHKQGAWHIADMEYYTSRHLKITQAVSVGAKIKSRCLTLNEVVLPLPQSSVGICAPAFFLLAAIVLVTVTVVSEECSRDFPLRSIIIRFLFHRLKLLIKWLKHKHHIWIWALLKCFFTVSILQWSWQIFNPINNTWILLKW